MLLEQGGKRCRIPGREKKEKLAKRREGRARRGQRMGLNSISIRKKGDGEGRMNTGLSWSSHKRVERRRWGFRNTRRRDKLGMDGEDRGKLTISELRGTARSLSGGERRGH